MQLPGPSKGSQLCVKECLEQGKGLWMTGGNGTQGEAALRARQKKVKERWQGASPCCCQEQREHSSHRMRNDNQGLLAVGVQL